MTTSIPNPEVGAGNRRFVLQGILGEGSFGAVYVAEMESTGGFKRRVALKLLHPNWDPGSDAGRRLRDEARLLGRLEHRNIVRVDDLLRIEGRWAVLMEYVPGADLEVIIQAAISQASVIPVRASLEIVGAAASALEAAFNTRGDDGQPLRVVHRDIKPSNIQLAETGDVKVLDFGVARADFSGREAKTERVRYGSVGYMAPERILGSAEEPAGDVYALGVTLFELLTLQTFGRAELRDDKHATQVGGALAAVRERLGDQADGIIELLRRCLQYEPETRPGAYHVEETMRALARRFDDDDIVTFARDRVAPMVRLRTDASVRGRVLTESQEGRERRSSQTIVVPGDLPELPASSQAEGGGSAAEFPPNVTIGTPRLEEIESPGPGWQGQLRRLGIPLAALAVMGLMAYTTTRREPSAIPARPEPAEVAPAPAVAPAELVPAAPTPALPVAAPADPAAAAAAPSAVAPRPPASARAPATAAPPPADPPATIAAPPPSGPVLRSVKFAVEGTDGITAVCGAVRGTGEGSVLLRNVPTGSCVVTAGGVTARVEVDRPRGFTCSLANGALSCR